jgi:hypothetical protein
MYKVVFKRKKDAQTPTPISTPAASQCWADPARSILVQLRALALGWTGGGARKKGQPVGLLDRHGG